MREWTTTFLPRSTFNSSFEEQSYRIYLRTMASSTVLSRLSSRLRSVAPKLTKSSLSADVPLVKSTSARRISRTSRLPVELSCLESMMPLHSAIASARLTSSLSIESKCWGLIPQGISMPL